MLPWLTRISGREMLTWEGVDETVMEIVNSTLKEHGFAPKLLPNSEVFTKAYTIPS